MTEPGDRYEETARLEQHLARLPSDPQLSGSQLATFLARRKRIGARQRQWRAGMPTLEPLFDCDEHRAKALAGNLATELDEMLAAWVVVVRGSDPDPSRAAHLAREWQATAARYRGLQDWTPEADEVFDEFLQELCDRAVSHAGARLTAGSRSAEQPQPSRLSAAVRSIVSVFARVFRPEPPH